MTTILTIILAAPAVLLGAVSALFLRRLPDAAGGERGPQAVIFTGGTVAGARAEEAPAVL